MATLRVVRSEHLPRQPFFSPLEALRLSRQMTNEMADVCPHHRKPPSDPDDGILGMCAHMVGCNYGFLNCGTGDAISLWYAMPPKYRRAGIEKMRHAPAGALLFWSGGTEKHGHVGIADGRGDIYGTDQPDMGFFGRVPVDRIKQDWGLTPKGWTFPFFELALVDPARRELRHLDRIITLQQDTIASAKKALHEVDRPENEPRLRKMIRGTRSQIDLAKKIISIR